MEMTTRMLRGYRVAGQGEAPTEARIHKSITMS